VEPVLTEKTLEHCFNSIVFSITPTISPSKIVAVIVRVGNVPSVVVVSSGVKQIDGGFIICGGGGMV